MKVLLRELITFLFLYLGFSAIFVLLIAILA
jgi:hypothetical protein